MKLMQTIHSFDVSLFTWVRQRKTQKFQVFCAKGLSKTGDGYLYLAIAFGLWESYGVEARRFLACLALAFVVERSLYFALKKICRRDRPPVALGINSFIIPSDQFSFPSGHTSAAFLMAVMLGWLWPNLLPELLAWATLVGMSRVILGVHFPTDTLVGALMGTTIALAGLTMVMG